MFFSIFFPHLYSACAMFRINRVSTYIYGTTYDRYIHVHIYIYIYIYENCTVRLASVGLGQAHPNNMYCPEVVGKGYSNPARFPKQNRPVHPIVNRDHPLVRWLCTLWAKYTEESSPFVFQLHLISYLQYPILNFSF